MSWEYSILSMVSFWNKCYWHFFFKAQLFSFMSWFVRITARLTKICTNLLLTESEKRWNHFKLDQRKGYLIGCLYLPFISKLMREFCLWVFHLHNSQALLAMSQPLFQLCNCARFLIIFSMSVFFEGKPISFNLHCATSFINNAAATWNQ